MAGSLLFRRTSKASNCACWFNSKIQEAHILKWGASHSTTIHFHQKNLHILRSICIKLTKKPEPNKEHICYNIEKLWRTASFKQLTIIMMCLVRLQCYKLSIDLLNLFKKETHMSSKIWRESTLFVRKLSRQLQIWSLCLFLLSCHPGHIGYPKDLVYSSHNNLAITVTWCLCIGFRTEGTKTAKSAPSATANAQIVSTESLRNSSILLRETQFNKHQIRNNSH